MIGYTYYFIPFSNIYVANFNSCKYNIILPILAVPKFIISKYLIFYFRSYSCDCLHF